MITTISSYSTRMFLHPILTQTLFTYCKAYDKTFVTAAVKTGVEMKGLMADGMTPPKAAFSGVG